MSTDRALVRFAGFLGVWSAWIPLSRAQDPIVRASVSTAGEQSNSISFIDRIGSISADGRHVAFRSSADNLVPGDLNGRDDAFVRDFQLGTTVRVSLSTAGEESNGHVIYGPAISGDGRFVAFGTDADNLVPDDTNSAYDVFVHDRDPDGNGVLDEGNGTTERVSVATDGTEGNSSSIHPTISADGDVVAFLSHATNLIGVDNNGVADAFFHVRSTGITGRASRNDAGVGGDDDTELPMVSADGNSIVFISRATNLDGGLGSETWDTFVHDRTTKTTRLASSDASGNPADQESFTPSISGDGRLVAFVSKASNLFPEASGGTETSDVFVKDMVTGAVDCMTVDSNGLGGYPATNCSISSDGTTVAFASYVPTFVPVDTNGEQDVFVRDVASKSIVCASVNCTGIPAALGVEIQSDTALSADGRFVVFTSRSAELVDDDDNGEYDVFVNDLTNEGFQAGWAGYGEGWPGTDGEVPELVTDIDPEFGVTIGLSATNSSGFWTVGFVLLGFAEAELPTNLGGTILVEPALLVTVIVPPAGWAESCPIPYDPTLCELSAYLQILEVDPGASRGVSFSNGLRLTIGR